MGSTPTGAGPYQVPPSLPDQPLTYKSLPSDDAIWSNVGSALYMHLEDRIYIKVWSDLDTGILRLHGRILLPDGTIMPLKYDVPALGNNAASINLIDVAEGWLLSLSIGDSGTGQDRAHWFVQVGLSRGPASSLEVLSTLISGYLSGTRQLSWPFPWLQDSTDGQGQLKTIQLGNPAAGAEFLYTVAPIIRERLIGICFTLTTAVAVATRGVRIVVDDGTNKIFQAPANGTQAASLVQIYNGGAFPTNPAAIGGEFFVPFPPDLRILGGGRVRSLTNNIQAADQYSLINLYVEDWFDKI